MVQLWLGWHIVVVAFSRSRSRSLRVGHSLCHSASLFLNLLHCLSQSVNLCSERSLSLSLSLSRSLGLRLSRSLSSSPLFRDAPCIRSGGP